MRLFGDMPLGGCREIRWVGIIMAAYLAWAGIVRAQDLKTALESASNGDTIVLTDDYDLNGTIITVDAGNVTLDGRASFNLRTLLDAASQDIYVSVGSPVTVSRDGLDSAMRTIVSRLEEEISTAETNNIYNSAAAAGAHGGIQAPHGGFSLKNLLVSGTEANIDASSGASKYMGLFGSTFNRYDSVTDPTDGQGMGMIENIAVLNNVVNSTGTINNVGNFLFFTQRRYDDTNTRVSDADRIETLDGIRDSVFIGNVVNADPAGSIGERDVGAAAGWVHLDTLKSSFFADNAVHAGHHAFGGALFTYSIGSINDTVFYNNVVDSDHDGYGGAVYANAIDSISGSAFIGNEAQGLDYGLGRAAGALGGAINATGTATMTTGSKGIGLIEDSIFAFNRAYNETGEEAVGGAINVGRNLGVVANTVFYGNVVESVNDGDAFGGAIHLNVNEAGMTTTITDSLFLNNTVITDGSGDGEGGAFAANLTTAAATDYALNLKATAGGLTEFSGNSVNGEANSLYFGKTTYSTPNQTNVTINVIAENGGVVAILDPIKVELDNGKAFRLTSHSHGAAGLFKWDGINDLNAAGGNTVAFEAGSNTSLESGFRLLSTNGDTIAVDLDNGANVALQIYGRDSSTAFFDGITSFDNVIGSNITIGGYYSFTDATKELIVAKGGDAASLADTTFTASGDSTFAVFYDGADLIGELVYKADNTGFNQGSRNTWASKPAFQEIVDSITGAEQAAFFSAVSANPENYVPSAHLNFAEFGFSANRIATQQALAANNSSRARAMGYADIGNPVSSSAYASPAYNAACVGGKFRVWAEYIGTRIDQDSKSGYSGYDGDLDGAVLGLSYDFSEVFTLGGYFSYSDGSADYDTVSANFDSDVFQGGLFAQYRSAGNGWSAMIDLSYTYLDNDSTRYASSRYDASFDQNVFGVGLETGYEFNPWCNGRLTPYAGLRYQHLKQDSIDERGVGPAAIQMDSLNADSLASSLGVSLSHDFVGENASFTPTVYAAWRHEFGDTNVSSSYRFAGRNTVTRVDSLDKKRDAAEIGAALNAVLVRKQDFSFGLNGGYNALISSDRVEHNFYAGVEFRF